MSTFIKSSFKIAGEQIDGAFPFDNYDYLLEAKWQQKPDDAGDQCKFAGVQGSLFFSAFTNVDFAIELVLL